MRLLLIALNFFHLAAITPLATVTVGLEVTATYPDGDPFTHTDLPDIDVEEDLKAIKNKNKEIVLTPNSRTTTSMILVPVSQS
jgi:hypothetical protein